MPAVYNLFNLFNTNKILGTLKQYTAKSLRWVWVADLISCSVGFYNASAQGWVVHANSVQYWPHTNELLLVFLNIPCIRITCYWLTGLTLTEFSNSLFFYRVFNLFSQPLIIYSKRSSQWKEKLAWIFRSYFSFTETVESPKKEAFVDLPFQEWVIITIPDRNPRCEISKIIKNTNNTIRHNN